MVHGTWFCTRNANISFHCTARFLWTEHCSMFSCLSRLKTSPCTHHSMLRWFTLLEFVAFLLWYVFLVLCCIVPTCCAYRRRRLIERRIVEQQANMAQFQQTNLFFLNANNRQNAISEEALQQERHRLLTETLKSTTMVSFLIGLVERKEDS